MQEVLTSSVWPIFSTVLISASVIPLIYFVYRVAIPSVGSITILVFTFNFIEKGLQTVNSLNINQAFDVPKWMNDCFDDEAKLYGTIDDSSVIAGTINRIKALIFTIIAFDILTILYTIAIVVYYIRFYASKCKQVKAVE